MRQRKDYSNTKVETRNLLTSASYRRFKQTDFNKKKFIVDIMLFLTQNFNPVNLDRKLDSEKERDMVKFLRDDCIPHEFVRYMYSEKNFNITSSPYLTYQKANKMVSQYFLEDFNRINTAKYKIEEKFELIHYVYSLLFSRIYNRTNNFGIKKKNNFDLHFATRKNRKTASTIGTVAAVSSESSNTRSLAVCERSQ